MKSKYNSTDKGENMCDKGPEFTDVSIKLGYERGESVHLVKVIKDAILVIKRCGYEVDYTDCVRFIESRG